MAGERRLDELDVPFLNRRPENDLATDAEGVTDELALEEIVNEPGVVADGASPNGGIERG